MQQLNLPAYDVQTKRQKGYTYIYDIIRKQYIQLTPEEWVRQHLVHYLIDHKNVPQGLIAVEMALEYNTMTKRSDIVIFSRSAQPLLLVECKAPSVTINQKVFEQVAMYNLTLQVPYLIVSNGLTHYCCYVDVWEKSFSFLEEFPDYKELPQEMWAWNPRVVPVLTARPTIDAQGII